MTFALNLKRLQDTKNQILVIVLSESPIKNLEKLKCYAEN